MLCYVGSYRYRIVVNRKQCFWLVALWCKIKIPDEDAYSYFSKPILWILATLSVKKYVFDYLTWTRILFWPQFKGQWLLNFARKNSTPISQYATGKTSQLLVLSPANFYSLCSPVWRYESQTGCGRDYNVVGIINFLILCMYKPMANF